MSYNYLAKNGPFLAFIGAVVCIAIAVIPIILGASAFEALPDNNQRAYAPEGSIFSIGIYVAATLLILAVALAILLSLVKMAAHPKGAMRAIISFAALVVLFLILYSLADAKGSGSLADTIAKFQVSDNISKVIGAGISLTLLLGIGSVISIILMEVWNFFKNQ